MLTLLLTSSPCLSCIFIFLTLLSRTHRTQTQNILLLLSLCSAIYFFAEYNYVTAYIDYHTFVIADAMSQYARPCIAPLMTLSLLSLIGLPLKRGLCITFIIASIIGTVSMSIYSLMGFDHAAKFIYAIDTNAPCCNEFHAQIGDKVHGLYKLFCIYIYQAINVLFSLICLSRIAWLFRRTNFKYSEIPNFFFRKGEIEPAHLMGIIYIMIAISIIAKIYIGRHWFMDHQTAAAIFCLLRSVLVLLVGIVGIHSNQPTITIDSLRNPHKNALIKGSDPLMRASEPTEDAPMIDELMLRSLQRIKTERIFLRQMLIDDAADLLGMTRTELSSAINAYHHCTYREHINSLRIEYAKNYYIKHPNIKQEVLAEECGFPDAPSFNKKFKQITGTTPRLWLLTNS